MNRPAILFLLSCLIAVDGAPPLPKPRHKLAAVHQGAGAQKLISKHLRIVVGCTARLEWHYLGDTNGIVFNVRSLRGPLAAPYLSWPIVATVTSNAWDSAWDKSASMVWFSVTASNTINGLESCFPRL